MILVEVAIQNARGFEPTVRIPLRPGINVLKLEDPRQRAAVLDCIYFPLFPDPARGTATAQLAEREDAKAVLSFYGRDKVAYRLMRNLTTGATRLYRFDGQAKRFALLSEVTQEAAQYVRVQQQLPDEVSFERLFLLSSATVPSRGPNTPTRSGTPILRTAGYSQDLAPFGAEPSGFGGQSSYGGFGGAASHSGFGSAPSFPGIPPAALGGASPGSYGAAGPAPRAPSGVAPGFNPTNALVLAEMEGATPEPARPRKEELQAERARLLEHVKAAEKAEKAERLLDRLQSEQQALQQRTARLKQLREDRDRVVSQLTSMHDLEQLPPGLRRRLQTFEEAEQRFRSERERLEREYAALVQQRTDGLPQSLVSDPFFVGGLATALLAWVLALSLGQAWIALFNLVGLVVAAGAGIRWIGELESLEKIDEKVHGTEERMEKLARQWALESSVIRKLMDTLSIQEPRELAERLDGYDKLKHQVAAAEQALEAAEADPELRGADESLKAMSERIRKLEAHVAGGSAGLQSANQLRQRIAAIDAELRRMGIEPGPGGVKVVRGTEDLPPLSLDDDEEEDGGYGSGSYSGVQSGGRGGATGDSGGPSVQGYQAASSGYGGYGGTGGFGGGGGPGGYGDPYGGSGAGAVGPDRSRELMQMGADLLQVDVEGLIGGLETRLAQYLSALTEGWMVDATFGPRGEVAVKTRSQQTIPFMQLPADQVDAVDLALRLCLAEAVVSRHRIPMILEDPVIPLRPAPRKMFVQMLEYLGKLTQVVCITDAGDLPGHPVSLESSGGTPAP
jgi:hypothetical protein